MILFSCDKEYDFQSDNKVAVNTLESSEITKNSVKIKAVINTNNGSKLTERGVCYSLSTNPTIANGKFIDNNFYSDLGEFTITVTKLSAGTKYYAKAYATNSGTDSLHNSDGCILIPRLSQRLAPLTLTPMTKTKAIKINERIYNGKAKERIRLI